MRKYTYLLLVLLPLVVLNFFTKKENPTFSTVEHAYADFGNCENCNCCSNDASCVGSGDAGSGDAGDSGDGW